MFLKKRFTTVVIFIFAISANLKAQTAIQTFEFANLCFQKQRYEEAKKLYKRVAFFGNDSILFQCNRKLAEIEFVGQNYLEAVNYIDQAYFLSASEDEKINLLLFKTWCYILSNNDLHAQETLLQASIYNNQKYKTEILTTQIRIDLETENYESLKSNISCPTFSRNNFDKEILKEIEKLERFSIIPYTSYILPGSAQAIAGEPLNGINALTINLVFLSLGYYVSVLYSVPDAVITIFPWFLRYYKGNIKNARNLLDIKKETRKKNIYKSIIKNIELNRK